MTTYEWFTACLTFKINQNGIKRVERKKEKGKKIDWQRWQGREIN